MKILSALFAVLFLFITTSIAQLRYALDNPFEATNVFLSLTVAIVIYIIGPRIKSGQFEKIGKIMNSFRLRNGIQNKSYRIG